MAQQETHVDNVKASGGKPSVVCVRLHVLDGSGMVAFCTMPFRNDKLIRIHVSGDHFASCAHLARQPTRDGPNTAGKIEHPASFAETCLEQHSARGCAIDLVEQPQASGCSFANVEQVNVGGCSLGAFRHVITPFSCAEETRGIGARVGEDHNSWAWTAARKPSHPSDLLLVLVFKSSAIWK